MSGQIDENGFPDFTADFDGRMISAAGGQTGNVVLLNGQTITFPWKPQQELDGTTPATLEVFDTLDGTGNSETVRFFGAKVNTESIARTPVLVLGSYYAAGDEPYAALACGPHNIAIFGSGQISMSGDLLAFDGFTSFSGGPITLVTTAGAGELIFLDAGTTLNLEAVDNITIDSSGGAVTIDAGSNEQISLTTAGGGDIFLTSGGAGASIVLDAADSIFLDAATDLTVTAGGLGALSWLTMFGAWTDFTPVVTQTGTVTKTVTRSTYVKLGRTVIWGFDLAITASGTANSIVTLSLPVTADATNVPMGLFWWYNGTAFFISNAYLASTTTLAGIIHGTAQIMGLTQAGWPNQLLNTHILRGIVVYESAS